MIVKKAEKDKLKPRRGEIIEFGNSISIIPPLRGFES